MKSKIRSLLDKLSFKKSNDDPGADEFYNDFYEEEEEEEEEELDASTPPLPDLPEHEEHEQLSAQMPDLPIEDEEETTDQYTIKENEHDEEYDQTDLTDMTDTSSIDLENGKVSFSDRLDHAKTRINDLFRRLGTKKTKTLTRESFSTEAQEPIISDNLQKLSKAKLAIQSSSLTKKIATINWQETLKSIFNPDSQSKYHTFFQKLMLILTVTLIGKGIGLALKGSPDYSYTKQNADLSVDYDRLLDSNSLSQLKSSNLFRTDKVKMSGDKPKVRVQSSQICETASRKTSLPIKFVHSIVLQDSVKSLASVQVRSNKKFQSFREGEKINNLAKLDKIEGHRLIIKNLKNGNCEAVEGKKNKFKKRNPIAVLSPRQSKTFKKTLKKIDGIKNDGNSFKIKKSFLQKKVADISSLLTQARGIQINNPDGTISFKVVDIEPGGIFAYLGIQNGDIISQINGEQITNLNQVMTYFGNISNLKKMNLTIGRSGQEVEQDYQVE